MNVPTLKDILTQQLDYVIWADVMMLDAAETVPEEELHRERNISAGSIHKLLLHAMGAQTVWLYRWQSDSTKTFPTPDEIPGLALLREIWKGVHAEKVAFVGSQTDSSLMNRIHYQRNHIEHESTLWHAMMHCFDHATYHRGQINTMIKFAGGKPCGPYYIDYRRQQERRA